MSTKIGEVIQASSSALLAECYELHNPPPLGGLVKTSDGAVEIYGVVSNASTESIELGRRPLARGREEASEDDIYRQNPQISMLLRTTFEALVVGHGQHEKICHYLPPRPPRVHGFVYPCERDEVCRFTGSLDFLAILVRAKTDAGDEVMAACLRLASTVHDDPRAFLVRAGKELAQLLNQDLDRFNIILKGIRP